jgi:Cytochrome oxidase complex assembly protein 1
MTVPGQPSPSSRHPRGVIIGILLAVGGVGLSIMVLSCVGLCAWFLFLARGKLASKLEKAGVRIPSIVSEPPPTDWNDWMVRRDLTHLYQTSLESVVADKSLAEKLGEPVAPALEADELFRRTEKGIGNGEHIEFEVRGPKAKGTVAVESDQGGSDGFQPARIVVTLSDGSTVDVMPLRRALPPVR